MSRFESTTDISSSGSQSSSDESDSGVVTSPTYGPARGAAQATTKGTKTPPSIADAENGAYLGSAGVPDVDTGGHANMMTTALLEFYCLSRAADILNAQDGSRGTFTRESPEVKYLGRKMYAFKSQFLSSHGVLAAGVDQEELGTTRQYYRDNLDFLGASALEGLNLDDHQLQPSGTGTRDLTLASRRPKNMQLLADNACTRLESPANQRSELLGLKQFSSAGPMAPLEDIRLDMRKLPHRGLPFSGSSPVGFPLFNSPQPPSPMNSPSRYASEFSEMGVLGRGSYGEVYHVQNHIDGQNYAVKKIPLSQKRVEQLQFGKQNHLETIMKEIRTLARLEHTNVVRYYGAWVEQAHPSENVQERRETSLEIEHEESQSNNILSHQSTDNQSYGIVFENSEDSIAEKHSGSMSTENSHSESTAASHQYGRSVGRSAETESISREFSIQSQGQLSTFGGSDGDIFSDGVSRDPTDMQVQRRSRGGSGVPAVVLHIQMSLHPTSLGSYLNPQPSEKSRRHCYHLVPSLRLLLNIISGVEYIHSKGIVHRDLKPANIFLSSPENVHIETCRSCREQSDSEYPYCHPRIGDFGLVADISHLNDGSPMYEKGPNINQVVGTEFYRPAMNSDEFCDSTEPGDSAESQSFYAIDEKLDIYALGVILFELLYRLNTKMERQLVLSELTRGSSSSSSTGPPAVRTAFPSDFATKVDMGHMMLDDGVSVAESVMACIRGMLDPRPQKRWRCSSVKEHLGRILMATERA